MPAMKFVVDFVISLVSEKMSKRVQIQKSMDRFEKLDQSLLPAEYGGKIPMKEMIEMCKQEMEQKRELIMSHDNMRTRDEFYTNAIRNGAAKSLKTTIASQMEDLEKKQDRHKKKMKGFKRLLSTVQGSFKKLEID
jgi:hypothetical protein